MLPLPPVPGASPDPGHPIRVALVGAGAAGRMIARHLLRPVPGIRLVAVANRTLDHARVALGDRATPTPETVDELEEQIDRHQPCAVADPQLVCTAPSVDVVVEATGTIDAGAAVALAALHHRKHVVLFNAELDATLGPLLKAEADRARVVLTNTDGDEPGVAFTLVRYLRSLGLRPVAAGNVKGLLDPHRTPDTQRDFARRLGLDARAATSFADGSKLACESVVLANATGFPVGRRGMFGPRCGHVDDLVRLLPLDRLLAHGLVDFALGAAPGTGAFVLTYDDDPARSRDFEYFKLGPGPLHAFHTPYHVPPVQLVATLIAAARRGEATIAPLGAPVAEVATLAKRDLQPGERLDGIGGFTVYGAIENAAPFAAARLLPLGLSADCIVQRAVRRDEPLTYDDVALPPERLGDRLRAEQTRRFTPPLSP